MRFEQRSGSPSGGVDMAEQQLKLEVPAQIKEVAEKTIDQAERSFHAFIEAANKSVSMLPNPTTDLSLRALSLTEKNMKSAFDHAKKLLHATDLQEAMRIQADFLKTQYEAATEQLKEIGKAFALLPQRFPKGRSKSSRRFGQRGGSWQRSCRKSARRSVRATFAVASFPAA